MESCNGASVHRGIEGWKGSGDEEMEGWTDVKRSNGKM